jgi:peptidylprolyl isomerase
VSKSQAKLKSIFVLICIGLLVLSFGCTNQSNPNGLMGLDANNKIDSNKLIDSNSQQYNNLNQLQTVKVGDKVKVNYTGRLQNGKIFDTSIGKTPLSFTVGAGQMIKGFDAAVIGMKVGESKTVTLPPEEAYGPIDQNKIIVFDKSNFQDFNDLFVGNVVSAGSYSGTIIRKSDTNAVIDFNHKLAGQTLVFDINMVSIN